MTRVAPRCPLETIQRGASAEGTHCVTYGLFLRADLFLSFREARSLIETMAQNESEYHQPFRRCDCSDYLRCKDKVKMSAGSAEFFLPIFGAPLYKLAR